MLLLLDRPVVTVLLAEWPLEGAGLVLPVRLVEPELSPDILYAKH